HSHGPDRQVEVPAKFGQRSIDNDVFRIQIVECLQGLQAQIQMIELIEQPGQRQEQLAAPRIVPEALFKELEGLEWLLVPESFSGKPAPIGEDNLLPSWDRSPFAFVRLSQPIR